MGYQSEHLKTVDVTTGIGAGRSRAGYRVEEGVIADGCALDAGREDGGLRESGRQGVRDN